MERNTRRQSRRDVNEDDVSDDSSDPVPMRDDKGRIPNPEGSPPASSRPVDGPSRQIETEEIQRFLNYGEGPSMVLCLMTTHGAMKISSEDDFLTEAVSYTPVLKLKPLSLKEIVADRGVNLMSGLVHKAMADEGYNLSSGASVQMEWIVANRAATRTPCVPVKLYAKNRAAKNIQWRV